jgi:hypothetical protein
MPLTPRRSVEPELLDRLPPDDPRAMQSRRDLRNINSLMCNGRIMARALLAHWHGKPPRLLLDLGSGDGTFMLSVARGVAACWRNATVILVDRHISMSAETRREFHALQWDAQEVAANALDVLEGANRPDLDIITANLFLHHLPAAPLERMLGNAAQRARLVVACEPRRDAIALLAARSLWALGCNDVSRHDAVVSVRAGFTGRELSALWPKKSRWELTEGRAMLFTHRFVARRAEEAM